MDQKPTCPFERDVKYCCSAIEKRNRKRFFDRDEKKKILILLNVIHAFYNEFYIVTKSKSDYNIPVGGYFSFAVRSEFEITATGLQHKRSILTRYIYSHILCTYLPIPK